jgi:hypothetical protein
MCRPLQSRSQSARLVECGTGTPAPHYLIDVHSTSSGITFTLTAQRDDQGTAWPTVSITHGTATITAPTLPTGLNHEPYPTWYARVYSIVPDASGSIALSVTYPEAHGTEQDGYGGWQPRDSPAWTWTISLPHWCKCDWDCDGFCTGSDMDAYTAAWELGDPSAEFNNDDFLNANDFDDFSAAWLAGCANP